MESTNFQSSVERNKAASKTCKRLFIEWNKPPTQGELQRIIVKSWESGLSDAQIQNAGNWWLWARNLMIENVFTKKEKELVMDFAVEAAAGRQNIHFITSRSPELLHAQIPGQGDANLPRSKKAIIRLAEIVNESKRFLPTEASVIFADLAIDNLTAIEKVCNVEITIQENLDKLRSIANEIGFGSLSIIQMSKLKHPAGTINEIINRDGTAKIEAPLDERAKKFIEIATKESIDSQKRAFGWNDDQAIKHNINLGITMGLVGQAIKAIEPPAILIHNESFIARGQLNNIFNSPDNPLPVISLRDLLETKKAKD